MGYRKREGEGGERGGRYRVEEGKVRNSGREMKWRGERKKGKEREREKQNHV